MSWVVGLRLTEVTYYFGIQAGPLEKGSHALLDNL